MKILQDACSRVCAANNQDYLSGLNLAQVCADRLRVADYKRPVLVTGLNWFCQSGRENDWLSRWPCLPACVVRVPADPRIDWVANQLQSLANINADVFVSVGGGSVLDASKVLAAFTPENWSAEAREIPEQVNVKEWWAIPTTAGTGSEVTPYASFIGADGLKFSFDDERLLPRAVFHDAELLSEAPAVLLAETAADALSQGIESLWATQGTDASRSLAAQSVSAWFSCAGDQAAMQGVALLAGAAIAISRTTGVHAVSYPMTARFGVSHGRALAALLPSMMALAGEHLTEECRSRILKALTVDTWLSAIDKVTQAFSSLDLPVTPAQLNFDNDQINTILAEGFRPDRMGNHPHIPDKNDLRRLLAGSND